MFIKLYRIYSQGICVAGCASMSFLTLGYLVDDIHKLEKKKIINDYEKQINKLKLDNVINK
jgi:hypothetical protein